MKKILVLIALLLAISITPEKTFAFSTTKLAGSSAALLNTSDSGKTGHDMRVVALENIFKKYNSPLVPYAKDYVRIADKYGVDWKLLPAISGLESYYANMYVQGSYNAYGWGGGYIYFKSWEDGIETVISSLKKNYIDKGADTVYKIGPIYAAATHWSDRVSHFMSEINAEYISLNSTTLALTL